MQKKLFATLTFVFLAIAAGIIVKDKLDNGQTIAGLLGMESRGEVLPESTGDEASALEGTIATSSADPLAGPGSVLDEGGVTAVWGTSDLVVGVSSEVPTLGDLPKIEDIPWTAREASANFRQLTANRCDLLEPGTPVQPPLTQPSGDRAVPVGRLAAFTIGLAVDPRAEAGLPTLTKSRIIGYMTDHRLAICPPIYFDPEQGYYLGNDVRAAFFSVDNPGTVVAPEPLISAAVRNLRVIGLVQPDDQIAGSQAALGRTLLLEFKFEKDEDGDGEVEPEFELLFIHLLPTVVGQPPRIAVFATDKGRQEVHELDVRPASDVQSAAAVVGTVRFDDFTLAGQYPAKPVVTGVRLSSRQSLSSELFRKTMNGLTDEDARSIPTMLDELHATKASL